jgi:hypothetical protein
LQVIVFNIILQWSGLGDLVLMMEWNPCCLIDNLYGEWESWFFEIINIVVSREQEYEVKDELYEGMKRTKILAFILSYSLFLL